MWALVKPLLVALLMKFGWFRWLLGLFGGLGVLLPLGLLLAKFGWPLLLILGILAAPLIIFLAIIGLPIFAVLAVAGVVLAVVAAVLVFGLFALKFFVFVVMPLMLVWWFVKWIFGWGKADRPAVEPRTDTI